MPLSSPQRNVRVPRSPQKHAPQFTSKKSQFHSFPPLKHAPHFTSKERQFSSFPSEACPSVHLKETSVSLVPLTEECPPRSPHRRMPLSSHERNVSFPRFPQKHSHQITSKERQYPSFPLQEHAPQFTSKKSQFHPFPSLKHAPQFTSKKRQFPSFPSEACPSVHLKNISFNRSHQKHATQFTSKKSSFTRSPH